jgi:hypothetical protein
MWSTCADVHKYITPVVTCNLSKVVSTAIDLPSPDKAVNLFYKTPFLGTHLFEGMGEKKVPVRGAVLNRNG